MPLSFSAVKSSLGGCRANLIFMNLVFLVRLVEALKRLFHCRTWQIESAFVLLVLALTALLSGRGRIEWIGVVAVWFTFMHASVSNRLEEMEAKRVQESGLISVDCYRWSTRYLFLKEVCWLSYFLLLGAWSALVGTAIFLAYSPWRRLWRKHHVRRSA